MSGAGLYCYAIAATAFALLAVYALLFARRTLQQRVLIVAALGNCLWAGVLAFYQAPGIAVPYWVVIAVELVRDGTLLGFLYVLAPSRWLRRTGWIVLLSLVAWAAFGVAVVGMPRAVTFMGLATALVGMVLLEQFVRNMPNEQLRGMLFILIGTGGMFAFDLFLFSQAEMLRGIDGDTWALRAVTTTLLVPFLALGARRMPVAGDALWMGRPLTFYPLTFFVVGVYVLLMAMVGQLAQRYGGHWTEAGRAVFLVGAMIVLGVLLGSVVIRRRFQVFLSKNFLRKKYDYRAEWLRFIRTLSGLSASDVPAACVQSVSQILHFPGGVLYRKPEGTSQFVPVGTWPQQIDGMSQTNSFAEGSSIVRFMHERRWIVDLREYEDQPDLHDHASLPAWLAKDRRWRLLSPILLGDQLLGFFLLLEPVDSFRLTYEDRDLLNTAGQHVATLLALQDADQRVAELSQLEAYNRLTTFVMHDLKNCAAQLQLLVGNAGRHRSNPQFVDDAFTTIAQTSERMMRLIAQLRHGPAPEEARPFDMKSAVRAAAARCASRRPSPRFDAMPDQACIVAADAERLISALEHVIRNAQEAAGELGEVRLAMEVRAGRARVWVRDSGAGMDSVFIRNRLFRPFDTTKGPTGMGIGAYQAREFARSVGGSVDVRSEPGQGTTFAFEFPLVSP